MGTIDNAESAQLGIEVLQNFGDIMVQLQAIEYGFRSVILSKDQLVAAVIADSFILGRVGNNVEGGAASAANTEPYSS